MKKIISILILLCLLVTVFSSCGNHNEQIMYENALAFLEEGNYEEAKKLFENLGDYADSKEHLSRFRYFAEKADIEDEHTIEVSFNEHNFPSQIIFLTKYGNRSIITLTYDQNGKLIQKSDLESDGEEIIFKYAYDQKGNLIKETQICDDGTHIDEYTYDENGNKIAEIRTFSDSNQEIIDYSYYTYDENGKLIKDTTIMPTKKWSSDYIYDEEGKLIRQFYVCSREPDLIHESAYESKQIMDYIYDENGNLIKKVYASVGQDSFIYNDYAYDENGNLIKEIHTDAQGDQAIYEYSYDEIGNLIRYTYASYHDDKKIYDETFDYIYDKAGNLIKEVFHNYYDKERINEYTYRLVYTPIAFPEEADDLFAYLIDLIDPISYAMDSDWYL